jgi:hypothetical protein
VISYACPVLNLADCTTEAFYNATVALDVIEGAVDASVFASSPDGSTLRADDRDALVLNGKLVIATYESGARPR